MLSLIAFAVAGSQNPTTAQIIEARFERARPKLTPIRFTSETKITNRSSRRESLTIHFDTIFKSKTQYKIERHYVQSKPDGSTYRWHQVTWRNGGTEANSWTSRASQLPGRGAVSHGFNHEADILSNQTLFHHALFGAFKWIEPTAILEESKTLTVRSSYVFDTLLVSATFDQDMFVTQESRRRPPMNRAQTDGWSSVTRHTRISLPADLDKAIQFTAPVRD